MLRTVFSFCCGIERGIEYPFFYTNIVLNSGKVATPLDISSLIINIIVLLHCCTVGLTVVQNNYLSSICVVPVQICYLRQCHILK